MYLEMVPEVCLPEKDAVAVLVRATELLGVLMRISMSVQLVLARKALVAALQEGGKKEREINK